MAQGSRPARVGDLIRQELSELIMRQVKDPGIGFITITHVKVTPDLQMARVYYTTLGDAKSREQTRRALDRAQPFLRRQVGQRLQLRRVPELEFFFDESIERGDRIERIIRELHEAEPEADKTTAAGGAEPASKPSSLPQQADRREDSDDK
jgi:ribosome-binding factor A